jgi:hypothetical protein
MVKHIGLSVLPEYGMIVKCIGFNMGYHIELMVWLYAFLSEAALNGYVVKNAKI